MKAIPQLAVFLIALSLPAAAIAQTSPTVRTSGVRVIFETVGEGFEGLVPFSSQQKGSALALLVESGTPIVKIDMDASELEAFTDDKGTNLLTKGKVFGPGGFGAFANINKDGKAGLVEISGGGVPAAGAAKLTAKGTLVLQTASKKKTVKSEPFELKKGTKFSVGDIALTVTQSGKPSYGEDAVAVEFETSNKAIETDVAEVKFLDATGKELESRGTGSSSMGFGSKFTYGRDFSLKDAVKGKVILQFEVWADLTEKKVPFSVTAGIGG